MRTNETSKCERAQLVLNSKNYVLKTLCYIDIYKITCITYIWMMKHKIKGAFINPPFMLRAKMWLTPLKLSLCQSDLIPWLPSSPQSVKHYTGFSIYYSFTTFVFTIKMDYFISLNYINITQLSILSSGLNFFISHNFSKTYLHCCISY